MPPSASEADSRGESRIGETPLQFGKYRLSRLLARGGMGEVYLARLVGELGFEKRLVIKTILPELAAKKRVIELFAAEAKTAVALTHGNIVPTYELGRSRDTFYIVMGYVDGPSVSQMLAAAKHAGEEPDLAVAMHIARGVLAGLAYAHTGEPGRPAVVHRDITPRNVLLDRSGQVRIVDFGIAAPAKSEGVRAGSTGFVAPEQARGDTPDPRADVFSAGCLIYELCTFKRAFPKQGIWVTPDLDLLPEELRAPIAGALAFESSERPRDAAALLGELRPIIFKYGASFDDQSLAKYLRDVFPQGWGGAASERSGVNPIRGFEGANETFATRLTAVTGMSSKETKKATDEELPAGSGTRLEPGRRDDGDRQRFPVAAVLLAAVGIGALAIAMSGSDPSPKTVDASAKVPEKQLAVASPPQADAKEPSVSGTAPVPVPVPVPVPDPEPTTRSLTVDPPDAELRVNGKRIKGKSPHTIEIPAGESVAVEIRKPGFDTRKFELTAGGEAPDKIALSKAKPKENGFLRVTAPGVPWAEVRLDGKKVGTTPTRKLAVPSGRHRLEVKCIPDACAESRVLYSKTITVEAGQLRTVKSGR